MATSEQGINQNVVAYGSEVTIAFRLSMSDGTEIDSATMDAPFVFTVGDGSMIDGLEKLLLGLPIGSREDFLVAAQQAFGTPDPQQIHEIPRSAFDSGLEPIPGTVFSFVSPSGEELPATIVEDNGDQVMVDFNHPLAGRDLQFYVEIIAIEEIQGERE